MIDDTHGDSCSSDDTLPRSSESPVNVDQRNPVRPALTTGAVTLLVATALSTHYWMQIAFLARHYSRYRVPWEMPRSAGFPSYSPRIVICAIVAATVANAVTTYVAVKRRVDRSRLWRLIQSGTALGLAAPIALRITRVGIVHSSHDPGLLQNPSLLRFWIPLIVGTALGVSVGALLERRSSSATPSLLDGLTGVIFWLSSVCLLSFVLNAYVS
jgi:uncharacterized protein involved in cysteine biosynthesis